MIKDNFFSITSLLSDKSELLVIVLLTLKVSVTSVFLASLIALPLGCLVAITEFRNKKICIVFLNALMGLPPVVVGLMVYLIFSRAGPLGDFGILFTPAIMIIAQVILIMPILCALTRQIIQDLWEEYEEQLKSFGIKKFKIIFTLLWDARFSLVTIILAGLGRALSEVGAVLIVGGNIEGVTRVMTTAITLETSKGDLTFALLLGAILLLIIFLLNGIIFLLNELTSKYLK